MQALSEYIQMLVIFDFSQTFARIAVVFDLKFKSLRESCGIESLSHQQKLV